MNAYSIHTKYNETNHENAVNYNKPCKKKRSFRKRIAKINKTAVPLLWYKKWLRGSK